MFLALTTLPMFLALTTPHVFPSCSFYQYARPPNVLPDALGHFHTTVPLCLFPPAAMYPPMEFGIPVTQPIPQIDPSHGPFDPAMMLHLPAAGSVFIDGGDMSVLPGPFSPQVSEPPKLRHISLTQGL